MSEFVKNAADETQVKAAGEREKHHRRQKHDDLTWVLSDRRGRRYYRRLVEHCGVFRSSYTGNSETFRNEGRREVGLKLWADLSEACPEIWTTMMQEKALDD